jgi:tetratricopeptide (TPR) repeat protein
VGERLFVQGGMMSAARVGAAKLSRVKRIWSRCEAIPILGLVFSTPRLLLLRRDPVTLRRFYIANLRHTYALFAPPLKRVYGFCQGLPLVGPAFTAARRVVKTKWATWSSRVPRQPTISGWNYLMYLRAPHLGPLQAWCGLRRVSSRIAAATESEPTRRRRGRSGYLYSYEFDAAVTKYSDIKSVIEHHERAKPLMSPFYRALYDLRSGVVLRMVWIAEELLEHHAKSFGLDLAELPPYQLLRSSYADLDPRNQSIRYLRAAIEQDPELAEAYYHLASIHSETGNPEEALISYRAMLDLPETIRHAPHDVSLRARGYGECGLVLRRLGRYEEALGCFEKAVAAEDGFGMAHRELAKELRRAKRYGEAAEHLRRAVYYRPSLPTLPALPARLKPASAASRASFHAPEILEVDQRYPVSVPALDITNRASFRLFRLYGNCYAVLSADSAISYPRLLSRDYAVIFVDRDWDKVVDRVDEFWGRRKRRAGAAEQAPTVRDGV